MPDCRNFVKDPKSGLHCVIRDKLTFGIIVGNRGFFPDDLASEGRRNILKVIADAGHKVIILSEEETPFGTVESLADARKCADLFKRHANEIDGIIVTLPNFGDERGVANTLRWSELSVPVLVHAESDQLGQLTMGQRRDSFCGKISVCNNLTQYGISFSLTTRHTCPVQGPEFLEDLERFAGICRVVNSLRRVRIGAIGTRPAAFNTVRYSEKILELAGISVEPLDLSEILGRIENFSDKKRVTERVAGFRDYVSGGMEIPINALEKMAKLSLVIEDWIEINDLDAVAIQCWTALEEYLGIVPCAVLSMLSNNLIPAACEVDVTGALSMLALQLASGRESAILDWNNNYGEDPDKAIVFHCSNLPASILKDPAMGFQEIIAQSVGKENSYGTISGKIGPGPFTFARLSTDDTSGCLTFYAGEGDFTDDELDTFGGYGVVQIDNLQDLLKEICRSGFEHHVAVTRGKVAGIVEEAFLNYLNFHP